MKQLYRKKQLIEVVNILNNGDRLVMNVDNPDDKWIIGREVFENTYEKVQWGE